MVQPGPWRQESSFAQALERAGHVAVTVTLGELDGGRKDAYLLVFGGRLGNTIFADVLAYDVARREWSVWCERWPYAARSYHTATVVGSEVWLCCGGSCKDVHSDVIVFNPATRTWRQPALTGDTALLLRTAHGACLHPQRPECILLMGGYGGQEPDFQYLDDIVEINTRTGAVRQLHCIGTPPEARAYHGFTAVGSYCYCVAGRTHNNRLVKGKQLLMVWDSAACKWFPPGVVTGELSPRSSHRMAAVPGGVLVFGGAVDKGHKSAEVCLLVTGKGRLSWRACAHASGGESGGGAGPAGRGAHAMAIVGGRLYVVGGYGEGRAYTADCWSLGLDAVAGCETAPPAASPLHKDAAARQSGAGKAPAVPEASQWREARRSCPAATFGSGLAKRQRLTSPAAAAAAAAAAPAAAVPTAAVVAPGPSPVAATPAALVIAAPAPASVPREQHAPPPALEQQQQQLQQVRAIVPAVCDPRLGELAELQQALQRERIASAAMQQQLADLMRQNGEVKSDLTSWRRKAEEEQAAASQANAALQQRVAEVADLQRQLRAAQQECGKAEGEVLELRSQQRRDRDRHEREVMDKDKRVCQLEAELSEQRKANKSLTDTVASNAHMLAQLQQRVQEEQQRTGEARVALAQERERLGAALQEARDEAKAAQQERDHLASRLAGEERALGEAREEMKRQQEQVRAAQDRARQAEEACDRARNEADAARRQALDAKGAADRARVAFERVCQAHELLGRARDEMGQL